MEGVFSRLKTLDNSKYKKYICAILFFLVGTALGTYFENYFYLKLVFLVLIVFCAALAFIIKKYRIIFIILVILFFGIFRAFISLPNFENKNDSASLAGSEINLHGLVLRNLYTVGQKTFYKLDPDKYNGGILFFTEKFANIKPGDFIALHCTIENNRNFFDKQEIKDGIHTGCSERHKSYSQATTGKNIIESILSSILHLQNHIKAFLHSIIINLYKEPQASFIEGILYGERGNMSFEFKQDLARTGTTHLIAISGYNITIVATAFLSMLILVGIDRKKSFWIVVLAIALFVFFTGAASSVVRAGIMGILTLVARRVGRITTPLPLIFTACFAMVLINPWVLLYDAGFALSFLALIGIVFVSPVIKKYGQSVLFKNEFIFKEFLNVVFLIFCDTFAATILTMPYSSYFFGKISTIGVITNIIIAGLVPYLMASSFISIILFKIKLLLFFPHIISTAISDFTVFIIGKFASIKFGYFDFVMPFYFMVFCYVGIFIFFYKLKNKIKEEDLWIY